MNEEDLERKLEGLITPELPPLKHQWPLKLAILSSKQSARAALWLLLPPFLLLGSALLQAIFHVSVPPWSWLQKYSPSWPLWLRMTIFLSVVIIFPLIAVVLNILSITWLQYDKKQKILHIAIRMRIINIIIILFAGLLALLFIGHLIADSLAGAD